MYLSFRYRKDPMKLLPLLEVFPGQYLIRKFTNQIIYLSTHGIAESHGAPDRWTTQIALYHRVTGTVTQSPG